MAAEGVTREIETDARTEPPTRPRGRAGARRGIRPLVRIVIARPLLSVAVLALTVAVVNVWWVAVHRPLGSLTIDEVGYMASGMGYHRALRADGPLEFLRLVFRPSPTGPLVPVLSVPFLIAGSRSVTTMFATQAFIGAVAAVAAAGCALRLAGRRAAVLTGLIVLSLPGMIASARSYQFGAAPGACMLLALWALLSSDRGHARPAMVGFGAAVGAMLLARSMALGFVPGLAIAALVIIRKDRRAYTNLGVSVVSTLVVAGPWWWASREPLFEYLFRFGYGDQAGEYGSGGLLRRAGDRWMEIGTDVRLPFVLLTLVSVVAIGVTLIRRLRTREPSARWSPPRELLALAVVVLFGVLALMSTANIGVWFELPLELIAVPLIVSAGALAGTKVLRTIGALSAIVAVTTLAIAATDPGGQDHLDGVRGDVQAVLYGNVHDFFWDIGGAHAPLSSNDPDVRGPAADAWWAATTAVTGQLEQMRVHDESLLITLSGSSQLMNGQSLRLGRELELYPEVETEEVDTTAPVDDIQPYLEPTRGDRQRVLVLMHPRSELFPRDRQVARLARMARDGGWRPVEVVGLPDGGYVEILDHGS